MCIARRVLCVTAILCVAGCARSPSGSLTLATTTSVQDSGLLDALVPQFRAQTGIDIKVIAVGTGQALALGRRGDADVLLVHDPASEQQFMAEGHGATRSAVCYNDFVLVGPPADPAGVRGEARIVVAFERLARAEAMFVSRGDESGTHKKEQDLWKRAGIEPHGGWYIQAGAGMAQILRMAGQKRAHALTDRGTFLAQRQGLDLAILSEGDPLLKNQYSVIVVSPEKHAHVHAAAAQQFADFLTSQVGRQIIGTSGVDRFGEPLFAAGSAEKP